MTNSFGSEVAETSDGARGGAPPRHPKFCAVYGLPSMLNHSCGGRSDTALKLLLMSEGGAIVFRATRDLEKGEELTHRYSRGLRHAADPRGSRFEDAVPPCPLWMAILAASTRRTTAIVSAAVMP
ncbi:unnamed protein product [Prorocentrum cordatum]|uniref:SET domain-containing protein n=1 Tax=Prorocentrum cordatum TaxID=2364126 RepID=A0ABN9T6D0_9DINO|nr:unnamed protein product [Polarella glacialis]